MNVQDEHGETPLMMAIKHCRITPAKAGNLDVVKVLLKNGAKVDVQNRDGQTAMTFAEALTQVTAEAVRLRSSIIALLEKAGASQ